MASMPTTCRTVPARGCGPAPNRAMGIAVVPAVHVGGGVSSSAVSAEIGKPTSDAEMVRV